MSRRGITRKFHTHYITETGVLMILTDEYVVLVRLSDGLCRRFRYEELE